MGGGLAAAAAERSMLRTPASRYADTLMEMDEDEINDDGINDEILPIGLDLVVMKMTQSLMTSL